MKITRVGCPSKLLVIFTPCFQRLGLIRHNFQPFNKINIYHQLIHHRRHTRCMQSALSTGYAPINLNRGFKIFLFIACRDHHSSGTKTFTFFSFTLLQELAIDHRIIHPENRHAHAQSSSTQEFQLLQCRQACALNTIARD